MHAQELEVKSQNYWLTVAELRKAHHHVEHEEEVVAVIKEELVTIGKLHHLMGHISLEAAKALVQKGLVEGFKLDETSKILSCNSCEYGKAHHKERKAIPPSFKHW